MTDLILPVLNLWILGSVLAYATIQVAEVSHAAGRRSDRS